VRIAVVNQTPHLVGGAETYLDAVLPALGARGHALALCTGTGRMADRPVIAAGSVDAEFSIRGDLAAFVRDVRQWGPDLVFLHGLDDPAGERACRALAPTAYFAHTYHGTCISGSKCFQVPTAAPCNRVLGPGCLVRYLPRRCGGLNPVTMVRLYGVQQQRRGLVQSSEAVLTLSEHMRTEYTRHGVDPSRVTVLPPWSPDPGGPVGPAPASVPPWHLLFLSRLERAKGGDLLLEALPGIARALGGALTLTVAGDGPERPRLEHLARRVTHDAGGSVSVEFVGHVAARQRTDLFTKAHVLVVPSVWPEPFGLVGLEAASAGVPAVAFPVGGIPEWLTDGVNGRLAREIGSPTSLADAVVGALEQPDRYLALRAGARAAACGASREAHLATLEQALGRLLPRPDDSR
jgi:glycosyltransferase involved in cell wall biosynthesis